MNQFSWIFVVVVILENIQMISALTNDNPSVGPGSFQTQIYHSKRTANFSRFWSTIMMKRRGIIGASDSQQSLRRITVGGSDSQQSLKRIAVGVSDSKQSFKRLAGRSDIQQRSKGIVGSTDSQKGLRPIVWGGDSQQRSKRIVGGSYSQQGSWPWQVALLLNGTQMCAGSLIDENWVVTAAHCALHPNDTTKKPYLWSANLGEHRLGFKEAFEQIKRIEKIVAHSNFSYRFDQQEGKLLYVDYDIALFKLKTPANFTKYIKPIYLLKENMTFPPGKECYVTGWGHTRFNGTQPTTLKEVKLKLVSHTICNGNKSYGGYIHDVALCAGFPEGGMGSCQFDSGGPLSCDDNKGHFYLTGVVSWGYECARPHKYDVFANMMILTSWVKKTIEEEGKQNTTDRGLKLMT